MVLAKADPVYPTTQYDPIHVANIDQPGTRVIAVSPALTQELGRGEAMLVSQIGYFLNRTKIIDEDGTPWIYKSYPSMICDWLPSYSESSVRRFVRELCSASILKRKRSRVSHWHVNHYSLGDAGIILLAVCGVKLRRCFWERLPAEMQVDELLYEGKLPSKMNGSHRSKLAGTTVQNERSLPSKIDGDHRSKWTPHIELRKKNQDKESNSIDLSTEIAQRRKDENAILATVNRLCDLSAKSYKRQIAVSQIMATGADVGTVIEAREWMKQHSAMFRNKAPHPSQLAQAVSEMLKERVADRITQGKPETEEQKELMDFFGRVQAWCASHPERRLNTGYDLSTMQGYDSAGIKLDLLCKLGLMSRSNESGAVYALKA